MMNGKFIFEQINKKKYKLETKIINLYLKKISKKINIMCLKLFEYDVLLLPFEKNNDIFISLNQKVKINFDFDKKDFVKNLHNKIINECNIKYNVHNFNELGINGMNCAINKLLNHNYKISEINDMDGNDLIATMNK